MPIDNFSELNGRYINDENKLSGLFKIYDNKIDIGVIDVDFKTNDSLIISYIDTAGYKKIGLKGKSKKNFFEVYFENIRIYLFPALVINNIDRLRIGKGQDNKLLIYKWNENYGMLMPFGAAGSASDEYQLSFSRYDRNVSEGLYAIQIDQKWGYANQNDSLVIAAIYDYVYPFKNGVAKVARNKQWGYIDINNKEVIPLIYDTIMKPQNGIIRVFKDQRWGLIDSLNTEIAAFKYDKIFAFGNRSGYNTESPFYNLAEVSKNGKVGFINKQGIEIIPAEYDEIELYPTYGNGEFYFFRTKLDNKYGYASANGILCKPVFEKAGKRLGYNGFNPQNKTLADKIGLYSEVIYEGEPYLFTEKGMLYKYKKLGFFKENKLVVDFDSGFYLEE